MRARLSLPRLTRVYRAAAATLLSPLRDAVAATVDGASSEHQSAINQMKAADPEGARKGFFRVRGNLHCSISQIRLRLPYFR